MVNMGRKNIQIWQKCQKPLGGIPSFFGTPTVGGWSKICLRDDTGNGTDILLLIMKIMLSAFINCYLALLGNRLNDLDHIQYYSLYFA